MSSSMGQGYAGPGYAGPDPGGRQDDWRGSRDDRSRRWRGSLFRHGGELALMIVGFVVFWPIGFAILGYYAWRAGKWRSGMGCGWSREGWNGAPWRAGGWRGPGFGMFQQGSGNAAFDEYRDAVMKRLDEERRKLDEEQMAFKAFVERLRRAKDQEEFDRFMAERNRSQDESNG